MISVSHLTKYYGSLLAVDDLSFEIDEGHVYGFLGPNGAGKTTTMNIMTGCLSATAGSVQIDGYDIFEDPGEAKKRIGYLPEQPPLYFRLSKKWLAPLFRGFHSSLAPTARPGSYAGKPLLRKAFCGFAVHAAKSD